MASAIWSTNFDEIEQMPAKYLFEFYKNHDLLSINPSKKWRVIKGGSKQYVSKLIKPKLIDIYAIMLKNGIIPNCAT